jgi:hypothetical protein
MAISLKSVLMAFAGMLVYYGFYPIIKPFLDTFINTHTNAFDIFAIGLVPLIIFFVIIISMFTNKDDRGNWYG